MKKVLITLTALVGTALSSFAQTAGSTEKTGGKFSIGLESALPVGDASDVSNIVIGGSLKFEAPLSAHDYFTVSAGYNSFLIKSDLKDLGAKSSINFVPLKIGIKCYSGGFFFEGQAGVVFSTESGGGSAFIYSPGVGYTFDGGFEAGVRYEGWPKDGGTTSQVGLRLAYRF